jgi:hypothetical protein
VELGRLAGAQPRAAAFGRRLALLPAFRHKRSSEMTFRHVAIAIALAGACFLCAGVAAVPASAATACPWAGTPAQPTGTFTINPGLTFIPSTGPLGFKAVGALGAPCQGTMTFTGQLGTGATCASSSFEGVVRGLPGVARFHGEGSLLVPSVLYDRAGNAVGLENADIVTEANFPHSAACTTPEGFRGGWSGMFSSVVLLF